MKILEFFFPKKRVKRLLQTLLNHSEMFTTGLCYLAFELRHKNIISTNDWYYLDRFIKENRPKPDSIHYDESMEHFAYYWPMGEWEPREEWIKSMIKK